MRINTLQGSAILVFATAMLVIAPLGSKAQTEGQSAAALVKTLTDPSPRSESVDWFVFGCGETEADRKDRTAAASLVALGTSALPEIEKAIDQITEHARRHVAVVNSWLILDAYARIKGPTAYPRLRGLIDDPNLAFLSSSIDEAVALAFGLTAYVSWSPGRGEPSTPPLFCRSKGLKDALSQLILAWDGNAGSLFERSLGPSADAALKVLLNGKDWTMLRSQLWREEPGNEIAIGYGWSKTDEVSEVQRLNLGNVTGTNPGIETHFKSASGVDCGVHRIRFALVQSDQLLAFRVDNSDLKDLVALITSCASK
jgi:hypothetical protein